MRSSRSFSKPPSKHASSMERLFCSPFASTFQEKVQEQYMGTQKAAPEVHQTRMKARVNHKNDECLFPSWLRSREQFLYPPDMRIARTRTSRIESSSSPAPPSPAPSPRFSFPPKRSASESAPGAQVVGLYEAADDATNDVGWRGDEDGDSFRIAAVVTGSHFAEEAGFDSSVRSVDRKNVICIAPFEYPPPTASSPNARRAICG